MDMAWNGVLEAMVLVCTLHLRRTYLVHEAAHIEYIQEVN